MKRNQRLLFPLCQNVIWPEPWNSISFWRHNTVFDVAVFITRAQTYFSEGKKNLKKLEKTIWPFVIFRISSKMDVNVVICYTYQRLWLLFAWRPNRRIGDFFSFFFGFYLRSECVREHVMVNSLYQEFKWPSNSHSYSWIWAKMPKLTHF